MTVSSREVIDTAIGKASEGLQKTVDEVAHLVVVEEEQTRKVEAIIKEQESHKLGDEMTKRLPLFRLVASRFPRLYYFTIQLVVPLIVLLGMAFLFGTALASLESPGEINNNDDALVGVFSGYAAYIRDRGSIYSTIKEAPGTCLSEYDDNVTVQELTSEHEDILDELLKCATGLAATQFPVLNWTEFFHITTPVLTFDWTNCKRAQRFLFEGFEESLEDSRLDYQQQYHQYVEDFIADVRERCNRTTIDFEHPIDLANALEEAAQEATGSQSCKPHVAGGALFWFTIMTTIGYGNTAPSTDGGRFLILTCGFITIIGFIGLNNSASGILMTIVDDFLLRLRLHKLTKGIGAVLLWLCLLIIWMLVLAAVIVAYYKNRIGSYLSLWDAYWFSYITTTTVGLGDIYIPHEEFKPADMFRIPFAILCSFVVLGNFATKLVQWLVVWFPDATTLESILAASRPQCAHQDKPSLPPTTNIERQHSF